MGTIIMNMRLPVAICLVALALAAPAAAFMFDMEANTPKCFSESMEADELVRGQFYTVESTARAVDMLITDEADNVLVQKEEIWSGKFAFTTKMEGNHKVCFTLKVTGNGEITPEARRVEVNLFTGVDAIDYSDVAKREDFVTSVLTEMKRQRTYEEEHRDTNESTNSRVPWFAIFNMGVVVSFGLWEVWYLRKYFKDKKRM